MAVSLRRLGVRSNFPAANDCRADTNKATPYALRAAEMGRELRGTRIATAERYPRRVGRLTVHATLEPLSA